MPSAKRKILRKVGVVFVIGSIFINLLLYSYPFSAHAAPIIKDPPPEGGVPTITAEERYIDKYFQVDKAGNVKHHIYLGDQKLMTLDNGTTTNYILSDHLGSHSITTNNTGQVTEARDYIPYGAAVYENVSNNGKNQYKFIGKEQDPETSLQYFGARHYDNGLGRFNSIDPFLLESNRLPDLLQDPQSLNTYAYSRNNPLNRKDPDGRFYQILASAVGIVAGGIWGSTDAYHLVQYTLQGDLQRAANSTDRFMAKVGMGLVTGLTLGEFAYPFIQRYSPSTIPAIEGGTTALIENTASRTISANPNSNIRFTQSTMRSNFSSEPGIPKIFQNKSINEVVSQIRANNISVNEVPINYVERDGYRLIDNTRSAAALQRAGIDSSRWNWQQITDPNRINQINERLLNNNLSQYGTTLIEY